MNNRQIILLYVVLFGCAVGLLSAHLLNSGLDMKRDTTLLISYSALFLSLIVSCISIIKMRKDNEKKENQ